MSLVSLLSLNGDLAQTIPGFVPRKSQLEMAQLIAEGIKSNRHVLVEAGTGTGKTFAYLIPAFEALKASNLSKVIIATGTKNLQDQLFYQDIPRLNKLFNVKVALLKGRNNYVCPERVEKHLRSLDPQLQPKQIAEIVDVKQWALQSKDGDLTELHDSFDSLSVTYMVTSTVDNCLAGQCPYFDECPVYAARNKALQADILVVNHHLLFADMALNQELGSGLLPGADLVIVDEAHDINDVARQFFGQRLSSRQFGDLIRDLTNEQVLLGSDDPSLDAIISELSASVDRLIESLVGGSADLLQALNRDVVRQAIENLDHLLTALTDHLELVSSRSVGMAHCYKRLLRIADLFASLTEVDTLNSSSGEYLYWLETSPKHFVIYQTPVSMADTLKPYLATGQNLWCFVSATLTVDHDFDHFKQHLGLAPGAGHLEARFDSPFNFAQQVKGYLPRGLPKPGSDFHTAALLAEVLPLIRQNNGRTFFLFTSHRALNQCGELLSRELDISFLKQGDLPKQRLLETFRQVERCVLLATMGFWQGVDVSGADLRCLIIDKLPFGNPGNPLEQVLLKALAQSGINGFSNHTLPEAAITLKQGFGRLTRNESDRGLFVLGDDRIRTKAYGKLLLNSLPEFEWYDDKDQALEFLRRLN